MKSRKFLGWCFAFGLAFFIQTGQSAQTAGKSDDDQKTGNEAAAPQQRETIAKPLSEKERKRREAKLRKELETPYRKWLQEDVVYIITDEERQAFKRLQTDEERDQFIEQFWLRRDPTPDTIENEYKEEHYRRIAYANEHFASGIPGWKADRGRIYITYGPPDEIDAHPSGGNEQRSMEEGGGQTSMYPYEDWRYRYIEGIGNDINIEFVDKSMSGEYRMTMDPSEKDALLYVPNAGLTLNEQMGLSSKSDRFNRTDGTMLGTGPQQNLPESMQEFNRLEQYVALQKPPAVKFKDLEAIVNSRISYNVLPIKVRMDFMRMTETTVLTSVTVQLDNKDLQFQDKSGVSKASVNMYARITSMSRRVVSVWEEPVVIEAPTQMLSTASKKSSIYSHSVYLSPGTYRLNVVVKDITAGNMNNYEVALHVPHFEEEKLATSTVILADLIEKVPTRNIGTGQFVIGDSKVRPRIGETFHRDEKMGIYLQIYNFAADEKTQKPSANIEYQVVKNGSNKMIFDVNQDVKDVPGSSAQQVTIEKMLPLVKLDPGQYTLKMTVTDRVRNQTVTPSATFTVD
jgi:GWxTD domain-containing protein